MVYTLQFCLYSLNSNYNLIEIEILWLMLRHLFSSPKKKYCNKSLFKEKENEMNIRQIQNLFMFVCTYLI